MMANIFTFTSLHFAGAGAVLAFLYLYKDYIFPASTQGAATSKLAGGLGAANASDDGASNDFVAKLASQKKRIVIFYGSQTGTAEEYAIKIAKEAKARFGTSSLVCDPEEYEFDKLDALPDNAVAVFVMATYGEGEPTDNSIGFMEFVGDEGVAFTNGDRLDNLKYVLFGLGNRTYEHYQAVARNLDARLEKLGATRIGERGEGDDDKSMEEDYLAWKDGMFEALAREGGFEEGSGGDVQDFKVTELENHDDDNKVYRGELSARALLGTKGIHDAKNPFPAPVKVAKELFNVSGERSCIHVEFDIEGSGISYQHGDHVAVWANNPESDVDAMLAVMGLLEKRDAVIDVESLDPTLAKVPFPVPTTYEAVFRHYLDISAHASRQAVGSLASYAPTEAARSELEKIGSDKAYFTAKVSSRCLKTAEVLMMVAGDDLKGDPSKATKWNIPFDRILSAVNRLGPRYYSISSSPKLHPKTIHVTAVVLRYLPKEGDQHIHGLATNYLTLVKQELNGEGPDPRFKPVKYDIAGPRGAYKSENLIKTPIHVRRSNFRLPTSPKIPIIMIGPGTGIAPFRSFIQERVASAIKAKEKNGPDALADWGTIHLYYTSRKRDEDFLYAEEWPDHQNELGDKFKMITGFSREQFKPGGGKKYVQDYILENGKELAEDILQRKGECI
jgi:NADPH-ferrihemoprotein reductase